MRQKECTLASDGFSIQRAQRGAEFSIEKNTTQRRFSVSIFEDIPVRILKNK